jgi:hypothetical protein
LKALSLKSVQTATSLGERGPARNYDEIMKGFIDTNPLHGKY